MSYTPPAYTDVGGSLSPGYTPPAYTDVGGDLIDGGPIEIVYSLSLNINCSFYALSADEQQFSISYNLSDSLSGPIYGLFGDPLFINFDLSSSLGSSEIYAIYDNQIQIQIDLTSSLSVSFLPIFSYQLDIPIDLEFSATLTSEFTSVPDLTCTLEIII